LHSSALLQRIHLTPSFNFIFCAAIYAAYVLVCGQDNSFVTEPHAFNVLARVLIALP